jgi:hypothetical protein
MFFLLILAALLAAPVAFLLRGATSPAAKQTQVACKWFAIAVAVLMSFSIGVQFILNVLSWRFQ